MYIEIKETFNDVDYTNGCTGNIISKRAVLTTAHCIDDMLSIKEITIIYGTNDKTDRDNTVRASKWRHHNDIGVIITQENIKFSDYVGSICLPTEDYQV